MREVGTQKDSVCRPLEEPVQAPKGAVQGNPRGMSLRRDGEGNTSTEARGSTLTRKATIKAGGARTANRHRWMRRES